MITQTTLKEWIHYDPETGIFMWLKGLRQGLQAGNLDRYRVIWIEGKKYPSSKLAWLYMTGEYPTPTIDHKNRLSGDDRWENLRVATVAQNNHNRSVMYHSSTGVKGVRHLGNRFYAFIRDNGVRRNLGSFATLEEARSAYNEAAKEIYGEFAS